MLPAVQAQYVGRVDTNQDSNQPTLRATAVLEYTGELDKPNASRLIPIAVWDGERYEPGSLYLAQPVPLTVETGTQYVLQQAGTPKGLFDVKAAADVGGSWIGIGTYQKPETPKASKLRRSRTLPQIMVEDDKPHFAHVPAGDTNVGATKTGTDNAKNTQPKSAPDVDPERPTLHRRPENGGAQSTTEGGGAQSTAGSGGNTPAADADPDRPKLHRASPSAASDSGQRETATTTVDPNRPHLEYGRPKEMESLDAPATEIAKLDGAHIDLEQIAAVSDAVNRPAHSYVYSWSAPEDEKKMQAALEAIAEQLLAKPADNVTREVTNKPATRRSTRRRKITPVQPALSDEQMKAFELSFGGGATLVFSATSGEGDAARYLTLIAQPDFNGTPIVLFRQVTSERELDILPRMKLVDAVDTDGDNRAELIFELERKSTRRYAIYRVSNNRAEQVFATGS